MELGADYPGFEVTRTNSSRALSKSGKLLSDPVLRRPYRPSHEQERAPLFQSQVACQGGIVADARLFSLQPL